MRDNSKDLSPVDQTPLFRAQNEQRYIRQEAIRDYEQDTGRSLVVFWGPILNLAISGGFADAIRDTPKGAPLDVMITSPGGDGETALTMANICRAERADFRVIVPDIAKSAATLLALAADKVVMSSTSALGPIDPQIHSPNQGQFIFVPARTIVEAIDDLQSKAQSNPHAYAFYASLLADLNITTYQIAKDATERTEKLAAAMIKLGQPKLSDKSIKKIADGLQQYTYHAATIDYKEASALGIPVEYIENSSESWDKLWRLHTRYVADFGMQQGLLIEGNRLSHMYE